MMGAYTSGLLRSHTLFVDVGAARAYQSDLARAFGHPVIGVDCRHDEAATLARHFANDTRTVIVHTCLSDRVGEPVKLYRAGDSSSAVQVNVAHGIEKRKASHEHEKTEVVRSTTLDDLLGHSLGASEDSRIASNANPPEVPNWCDGYATAAWPCTHGHAHMVMHIHVWSCTYARASHACRYESILCVHLVVVCASFARISTTCTPCGPFRWLPPDA